VLDEMKGRGGFSGAWRPGQRDGVSVPRDRGRVEEKVSAAEHHLRVAVVDEIDPLIEMTDEISDREGVAWSEAHQHAGGRLAHESSAANLTDRLFRRLAVAARDGHESGHRRGLGLNQPNGRRAAVCVPLHPGRVVAPQPRPDVRRVRQHAHRHVGEAQMERHGVSNDATSASSPVTC
jgi:hypothetical protein